MGNEAVHKIKPEPLKKFKKYSSYKQVSNPTMCQNTTTQATQHSNRPNSARKYSNQTKISEDKQLSLSTEVQSAKFDSWKQIQPLFSTKQNIQGFQNIQTKSQSKDLETKQFLDQKIFIFDWDDTLFFSTFLRLNKNQIKNLYKQSKTLKKYDERVIKILKKCLEIGQVYIVTNSKQGWVKHSSELFLPKTSQLIFNQQKIKVISSRPKSQQFFDLISLNNWKYESFKEIMNDFISKIKLKSNNSRNLHLICIGDSEQEIQAGHGIYKNYGDRFDNLYIKTIKLQEFPTIEDLIEQQQLFLSKLQVIVNTQKRLVIKLQRPKRLQKKQQAQ